MTLDAKVVYYNFEKTMGVLLHNLKLLKNRLMIRICFYDP